MVAIFVVLTIVAFVLIDALVQRADAWQKEKDLRETQPSVPTLAFALEGATIPSGFFIDSNHAWVRIDVSGRAQVGMDDFVERVIGHIDEVKLPKVGQEVRRGEKLFGIRQGSREALFDAPLDGVVDSVNENVAAQPDVIQTDPYQLGWICTLKPRSLAKNLRRLFVAEAAVAWFKSEVERFQDFISARPLEHTALGQVLQDGGQPTGGVLELMDEETWYRNFS